MLMTTTAAIMTKMTTNFQGQKMVLVFLGSTVNFIQDSSHTMNMIMGKKSYILMIILWLNSLNYRVLVIMAVNDTFNSRGYTDRKKKIIREWNKTNSSPR